MSIQEKTDDRVIIVESITGKILFLIAAVVIIAFVFLFISLLLAGFLFLGALYTLLVSRSVTIDKKSQKITIDKKSIIKHLNSTREVPFSRIAIIEVNRTIYSESESRGSWSINLFTIDRESIEIYCAKGELDAKSVAETISKIIETDYLIVPINQCTKGEVIY